MHYTFPSASFDQHSDTQQKIQIMQSSQHYSYFFPFRPKYFPQHHILKHIQSLYFFPYVSKDIKKTNKVYFTSFFVLYLMARR